jgi:2'-5' RNA ligase
MITKMQSAPGETAPGEEFSPGEVPALNHFALVAYIPEPLGRFLDDLRLELTPGCRPHAHVTVLPPRPLHHELSSTIHQLDHELKLTTPFCVDLGEIRIFDTSHVVYLGVTRGYTELLQLYAALNCDCLSFSEPFPYHPHITIAQNVPPEEAARLAAVASERWAEYRGPRSFEVSRLSFVQQVAANVWTDVPPYRWARQSLSRADRLIPG